MLLHCLLNSGGTDRPDSHFGGEGVAVYPFSIESLCICMEGPLLLVLVKSTSSDPALARMFLKTFPRAKRFRMSRCLKVC